MIINSIIVSGRLGADAETREAGSKLVTNFRMAVYQGKDKPATWVKVTAWEKTAEFCQGITKGSEVIVEGSFSTSEYTTKDGVTKTSVEIRASRVHQLAKVERKEASEAMDSAEDVPF